MKQFEHRLNAYTTQINDMLCALVGDASAAENGVAPAMLYSVSAGGKRIRPILMLEFCRMCGGSVERALPVACALEMIHTYSLIHDDLPSMDNDDYRRGRPSCHKRFGEAYAILAGDALLTLAFEMLARIIPDPDVAVRCISELAKASGIRGMVGGQELDLAAENRQISERELERLHSLKTGALITAACRMGCIVAGANQEQLARAAAYSQKLGLAFQIVDDILDVEGDPQLLGKPVGSDAASGKTTYVSLLGMESAKEKAKLLTDEALALLSGFHDSQFLMELTEMLLMRKR